MALYKRNTSANWWVQVTVRGRTVRQSTGTKDRGEAERYEHALRTRLWEQQALGERHHTWGEACQRFLTEHAHKRSAGKDAQIARWWGAALAHYPLAEVRQDVLAAARDRLVADQLAPATVNHYLAFARSVLRAAVGYEWLDRVPVIPMMATRRADPRWLTREQFKALRAKLPPHLRAMATFAVSTGLRRGNITGLRWEHVDLDRATLHVPSESAKANRGIAVPLNDDALAVLRALPHREGSVFRFRGKPVYQVATAAWRRAVAAVGLPGFRFHDLRHTWASWHVQGDTPLPVLQALGGWQSPQMVQRYAHLSAESLAKYAGVVKIQPVVNVENKSPAEGVKHVSDTLEVPHSENRRQVADFGG